MTSSVSVSLLTRSKLLNVLLGLQTSIVKVEVFAGPEVGTTSEKPELIELTLK